MTPSGFVIDLILVVIALGLSHILTGIAKMIRSGVSRWSPLLIGWIVFLLHEYLNAWFHLWSFREVTVWTQSKAMFILAFTSLVFIASWLITPEPSGDEPIDQVAFYDANRRKFIGILVIYASVGCAGFAFIIPNWLHVFWFWNMLAMALCMVAAWIWSDRRIQYAAMIGTGLLAANFAFNGAPVITGVAG